MVLHQELAGAQLGRVHHVQQLLDRLRHPRAVVLARKLARQRAPHLQRRGPARQAWRAQGGLTTDQRPPTGDNPACKSTATGAPWCAGQDAAGSAACQALPSTGAQRQRTKAEPGRSHSSAPAAPLRTARWRCARRASGRASWPRTAWGLRGRRARGRVSWLHVSQLQPSGCLGCGSAGPAQAQRNARRAARLEKRVPASPGSRWLLTRPCRCPPSPPHNQPRQARCGAAICGDTQMKDREGAGSHR